jgi:hypothetical protein
MGRARHADLDGLAAIGEVVELGELGAGCDEADVESADFTEPAFVVGDAVDEVPRIMSPRSHRLPAATDRLPRPRRLMWVRAPAFAGPRVCGRARATSRLTLPVTDGCSVWGAVPTVMRHVSQGVLRPIYRIKPSFQDQHNLHPIRRRLGFLGLRIGNAGGAAQTGVMHPDSRPGLAELAVRLDSEVL